jgi:Zn-finger nucleic acid-binding protein
MTCPVSNEPMIVLELNEIEIDYCSACKGIWLDGGELELLIEDENERRKILSSFQIEPDYPEKKYKCPICKKKMDKVYVGGHKKVLIDKCPAGHGLWFDKGELKSVIELSSGEDKVIQHLNDLFGEKLTNNQNGENK